MDQTTQRFATAAGAIVLLTAAAFVFLVSRDEPPTSDPGVEAAGDILDQAIIEAVTEVAKPDAGNDAGQAVDGDASTARAQHKPAQAQTTPERPREDQVMADPGPNYMASSVPVPAELSKKDDAEKLGTLDRDVIRQGIQSIRPTVEKCYHATLKDFPEAEGTIVLGFTIAAEDGIGRVELAEPDQDTSTLIDTVLHDCMTDAVGAVEFPAPQDGKVNVRYPFKFAAQADSPDAGRMQN